MAGSDPLVLAMRDAVEGRPMLTVYHEWDGDAQCLTGGVGPHEKGQLVRHSHIYEVDT